MEHIFWSIVNSISNTIEISDVNMIIGAIVVVMFGWCAKGVWDAICGKH